MDRVSYSNTVAVAATAVPRTSVSSVLKKSASIPRSHTVKRRTCLDDDCTSEDDEFDFFQEEEVFEPVVAPNTNATFSSLDASLLTFDRPRVAAAVADSAAAAASRDDTDDIASIHDDDVFEQPLVSAAVAHAPLSVAAAAQPAQPEQPQAQVVRVACEHCGNAYPAGESSRVHKYRCKRAPVGFAKAETRKRKHESGNK